MSEVGKGNCPDVGNVRGPFPRRKHPVQGEFPTRFSPGEGLSGDGG